MEDTDLEKWQRNLVVVTCFTMGHGAGRLLVSHIDGDSAPLRNVFHRCRIDIADCFAPVPMTNVGAEQVRAA